jgi:hypothetical protein
VQWVNNCVGARCVRRARRLPPLGAGLNLAPQASDCLLSFRRRRNQKYFILFTTYVMASSAYAMFLVGYTLVAFPREKTLDVGSRSCLIFLFLEAVLFGLFTLCMTCEQLGGVVSDTSTISRMQGEKAVKQWSNTFSSLSEVFGGAGSFQLSWFESQCTSSGTGTAELNLLLNSGSCRWRRSCGRRSSTMVRAARGRLRGRSVSIVAQRRLTPLFCGFGAGSAAHRPRGGAERGGRRRVHARRLHARHRRLRGPLAVGQAAAEAADRRLIASARRGRPAAL